MSKNLPSGWLSIELGQLFEPRSMRVAPSDMPHAPYIGLEHVEAQTSRLLTTVPAGTMSSSAARFFAGDVLYGRMRPYLNKVVQPQFDGLASAEFIVFATLAGIDNRFVHRRISASDFVDFACSQYEGDRPRVKFDQLGKFELALPPAAEQTRIVEKLEELLSDLDAGVAELKAAQKKLGQYRQSLLQAAVEGALTAEWRAAQKVGAGDAAPETGAQLLARILQERRARWEAKQMLKFESQGKAPPKDWQKKYPEPVQPDTTDLPELPQGWGWASVEQLSEVLSGFAYKSTDFCSEGVPVTKIANIGYGVYELDTAQEFLPSIFLKDTSDFIVSEGVVLIALTRPITNGTLKSCLYPNHLPVSLLNQRVAALKVISPVLADYFYLLTRTPYFREQVRTSTSETLQPNMSPNALKVISLPLPSLCEAQKLVELTNAQLTEVGNQEIAINISIKQSTAQRQNILRAAFAGQLVPQDPNDEPASVLLERIRAERAALYASRTRRSINRAKAEKS